MPAKKDRDDTEIAELLCKLREETAKSGTEDKKAVKKQKKLTDDDVKALLRKYYGDTDTLPEDKPPAFEVDTTDFAEPDPDPEDAAEPVPAPEPAPEPETKPEEVKSETSVEPEQEIGTETVPEPEVIPEPEPEIQPEPVGSEPEPEAESEIQPDPEPAEETEEEASDEESLDKIIYDTVDDISQKDISPIGHEHDPEPTPAMTEEQPEPVPEAEAPVAFVDEAAAEKDTAEKESDTPSDEPHPEETAEKPAEEEAKNEEIPTLEGDDDDSADTEWHQTEAPKGLVTADDSNLKLLVALGFGDKLKEKYGDDRVRGLENELKKSWDKDAPGGSAYGYRGREYSPDSDIKAIKSAYSHDLRMIILRLVATAVLSLVLLVYENAAIFGITFPGILNCRDFPTSYTLISLQLLVLCAAASYRRIFDGFLCMTGKQAKGDQVLCITFAVAVVCNIVTAIIAPTDGVILYNFPVSLGFLFGVTSELLDCRREYYTFLFLSKESKDKLYGIVPVATGSGKEMLVAGRIGFADGFFDSNMVSRAYDSALIFTVIPLAAFGAVLSIMAAIFGQSGARAFSAFFAAVAFAAPLSWTVTGALQCMCLSDLLGKKKAAVIGSQLPDETVKNDTAVFGDDDVFDPSKTKILGIKIFDNSKIYATLYEINALFSAVGGPMKEIMRFTAANLGDPESAELTAASERYAEALIDGKTVMCAGSAEALAEHGITVPAELQPSEPGVVTMYAARDGAACACINVRYAVVEGFAETVASLRENGVAVKIRTVDPNVDRLIISDLLGGKIPVGVVREPAKDMSGESCVTQIVARGNAGALALPLIKGRKFRRLDRNMTRVRTVQSIVAVLIAATLTFTVPDAAILPAAAALTQLVCLIPGMFAFRFTVRK